MDENLEIASERLQLATCAEDVFGDLKDPEHKKSEMEVLKDKFDEQLTVLVPSQYTFLDDIAEAEESAEMLVGFFERAKARVRIKAYGERRLPGDVPLSRLALDTGKRSYYVGDPIAEGTIATVFEGECLMGDEFAGKVVVKLVNDPADNVLIQREAAAIRQLRLRGGPQRKHLPVYLDKFVTADGRAGIILRKLTGHLDLADIREVGRWKHGVDRKHMVWMLSRCLSALGYAHSRGVVHGNIEPAHLLVEPRSHNVVVIDWAWSAVKPRETGDAYRIATEQFSAPEVFAKACPHPSADIFALGKCMIYILGGNVADDSFPSCKSLPVEEPLQRFLRYMVMGSPKQRASDAWQLYHSLQATIIELWGKKNYLEFRVD